MEFMLSAQSLAVPFFATAVVLALSGLAKLRQPGPLVRMFASTGIPVGPAAVRALSLGELGLGAVCLAAPTRIAAFALGSLYAGFAAFLAWLLVRRIEVSSCGCSGKEDVPPSWIHVGLNLAAAAAAMAAAASGPAFPSVAAAAARLPVGGTGFLVGVAAIAALGALCAAYLPTVLLAYRGRP
jgi:hypothetical protein